MDYRILKIVQDIERVKDKKDRLSKVELSLLMLDLTRKLGFNKDWILINFGENEMSKKMNDDDYAKMTNTFRPPEACTVGIQEFSKGDLLFDQITELTNQIMNDLDKKEYYTACKRQNLLEELIELYNEVK